LSSSLSCSTPIEESVVDGRVSGGLLSLLSPVDVESCSTLTFLISGSSEAPLGTEEVAGGVDTTGGLLTGSDDGIGEAEEDDVATTDAGAGGITDTGM